MDKVRQGWFEHRASRAPPCPAPIPAAVQAVSTRHDYYVLPSSTEFVFAVPPISNTAGSPDRSYSSR